MNLPSIITTAGRSIADLFPANTSVYNAPTYTVRGTQIGGEKDMQTLRHTLFGEMSNLDPKTQATEAQTIINTALNRIPQYAAQGKNMTLGGVLAMPNQYQAYNGPQFQKIATGATTSVDQQKIKVIDDAIAKLKTGNFADNTNNSVFYHHDPVSHQVILKPGPLFTSSRTVANLTQP